MAQTLPTVATPQRTPVEARLASAEKALVLKQIDKALADSEGVMNDASSPFPVRCHAASVVIQSHYVAGKADQALRVAFDLLDSASFSMNSGAVLSVMRLHLGLLLKVNHSQALKSKEAKTCFEQTRVLTARLVDEALDTGYRGHDPVEMKRFTARTTELVRLFLTHVLIAQAHFVDGATDPTKSAMAFLEDNSGMLAVGLGTKAQDDILKPAIDDMVKKLTEPKVFATEVPVAAQKSIKARPPFPTPKEDTTSTTEVKRKNAVAAPSPIWAKVAAAVGVSSPSSSGRRYGLAAVTAVVCLLLTLVVARLRGGAPASAAPKLVASAPRTVSL